MLRLLIVDDEQGIRNGIASYFPWAGLGIEVAATCQDGCDALELLAKSRFDLVLCDVRMPRMDGIALAEAIRERSYPCEIVFMSAYKDFEYAKKAIELGIKNYIVKPAGYEEIREVFAKLVSEISARPGPPSVSHNAPERPARGDPVAEDSSLPERTQRIIEGHLKDITLPEAASMLGMSPNYLSARLHKETGTSFFDLLTEIRMTRAAALLADRDLRVAEVGARVGYTNSKSFIRAFKAYHGRPPSAFRGSLDR
jgi:Response regulator containing CheY-like receiver domain and AraC-type DNA-binding domain